jgi:hypothetical protein
MTQRLARYARGHICALRDSNDPTSSPGCPPECGPPDASPRFISRPTLHLLLACATLAAIWLLLLPGLLHLAPIRNHVDHLDVHDVDASAMYYTELEPVFLLDYRAAADGEARAAMQR